MRSLNYVLGGEPKNNDDCLDFAEKHKLLGIKLRLRVEEVITEQYIFRQLFGIFTWDFEDNSFTNKTLFGVVFAHESIERQQLSLSNANERLASIIEKITSLKAPFIIEDSSFSPDKTLYRQ